MADRFSTADPGLVDPGSTDVQPSGAGQDPTNKGSGDDGRQPWHADPRFRDDLDNLKAVRELKAMGLNPAQIKAMRDEYEAALKGEHPKVAELRERERTATATDVNGQWEGYLKKIGLYDAVKAAWERENGGAPAPVQETVTETPRNGMTREEVEEFYSQKERERTYENDFATASRSSPYAKIEGYEDGCKAYVLMQMQNDRTAGKHDTMPSEYVKRYDKILQSGYDVERARREAEVAARRAAPPSMPPGGKPAGMSHSDWLAVQKKAIIDRMRAEQRS